MLRPTLRRVVARQQIPDSPGQQQERDDDDDNTDLIRKIHRMVIRTPSTTIEELMKQLGDRKPSRFTVATIRTYTLATLRECARMQGVLTKEYKSKL